MRIEIGINAIKDLNLLKESKPKIAAKALALLKQMAADENVIDRLTDKRSSEGGVSVSRWVEQFYSKAARNLYRIKTIDNIGNSNSPFRVIYAYLLPCSGRSEPEVHVLAVVLKSEFNYEANNKFTIRIISDYDSL